MSSAPGFFTRLRSVDASRTDTARETFVNLGEDPSGFSAIAAAIIDDFENRSRSEQAFLKEILSQYNLYYPQSRLPGLATPAEQMNFLCDRNPGIRRPELLATMAYVLRQIAVDEMLKHPERYRNAFIGNKGEMSPADLRESDTVIDKACVAGALAQALKIPVRLAVTEAHKELPLCQQYNQESQSPFKPSVDIQFDGHSCSPKLKNPARFDSVVQRKARKVEPRVIERHDPDIREVLAKIAESDQKMLSLYKDTEKRLQSALNAGELNKEDLLDLYISAIDNPAEDATRLVGLEHGSQRFFDAIQSRQQPLSAAKAQPFVYAQLLTQELIKALARAVATGQLSQEKLFAADAEPVMRIS